MTKTQRSVIDTMASGNALLERDGKFWVDKNVDHEAWAIAYMATHPACLGCYRPIAVLPSTFNALIKAGLIVRVEGPLQSVHDTTKYVLA